MTTFFSPPPELLLKILAAAVSGSPSPFMKDRNRDLRSFALVHRSWTAAAVELLAQEVHVYAESQNPADHQKDIKRIGRQLRRSIQFLTVHADLGFLLEVTDNEILESVRHLTLYNKLFYSLGALVELRLCACFPSEPLPLPNSSHLAFTESLKP